MPTLLGVSRAALATVPSPWTFFGPPRGMLGPVVGPERPALHGGRITADYRPERDGTPGPRQRLPARPDDFRNPIRLLAADGAGRAAHPSLPAEQTQPARLPGTPAPSDPPLSRAQGLPGTPPPGSAAPLREQMRATMRAAFRRAQAPTGGLPGTPPPPEPALTTVERFGGRVPDRCPVDLLDRPDAPVPHHAPAKEYPQVWEREGQGQIEDHRLFVVPPENAYRVRSDAAGVGPFNSSRKDIDPITDEVTRRLHEGLDISAAPGEELVSLIDGEITHKGEVSTERPGLRSTHITGTGRHEGMHLKIFYVGNDDLTNAQRVEAGRTVIGPTQDMVGIYGDPRMDNHFHIELRIDDKLVDPADYFALGVPER